MAIQLDHVTVPTNDKVKSAQLLGELLGVAWAAEATAGPFAPVYVSDELTMDFDEAESNFPIQHFAFKVTESEFNSILGRIVAAGLSYRSNPHGPMDMKINTEHGGQIVYWNEPGGHIWEILTVSYARNPTPERAKSK